MQIPEAREFMTPLGWFAVLNALAPERFGRARSGTGLRLGSEDRPSRFDRRAHTQVPSSVTTPPANNPARLISKIASDLGLRLTSR
jgi:hypothetical protein